MSVEQCFGWTCPNGHPTINALHPVHGCAHCPEERDVGWSAWDRRRRGLDRQPVDVPAALVILPMTELELQGWSDYHERKAQAYRKRKGLTVDVEATVAA